MNQPLLLTAGTAGTSTVFIKDIADRLFRKKRIVLISFTLLNIVVLVTCLDCFNQS